MPKVSKCSTTLITSWMFGWFTSWPGFEPVFPSLAQASYLLSSLSVSEAFWVVCSLVEEILKLPLELCCTFPLWAEPKHEENWQFYRRDSRGYSVDMDKTLTQTGRGFLLCSGWQLQEEWSSQGGDPQCQVPGGANTFTLWWWCFVTSCFTVRQWKCCAAAECGYICPKKTGIAASPLLRTYDSRCRSRAYLIMRDTTLLVYGLFVPLPSGRRLTSIKDRTSGCEVHKLSLLH